ncbi:MAG: CapA family protein [Candidatus Nealsonbacteria bacterium]|nr:CapA family protein [Candidatus Nealsonbacteria bacterium]
MKKFLIFIILTEIIVFAGSGLYFNKETNLIFDRTKASLVYSKITKKIPSDLPSKVTLFAVGDIMLDRGVEYIIKKEGKNDFKFPFLKIADELKKADLLIGNLEGPISNRGEKIGSIYSFRMNLEAINGLEYAGFDVLSLANNHALDYGRVALEDTMNLLKQNGIEYTGAGFDEKEVFSVKIKEVKGIKIGFLAFTDFGSKFWKPGTSTSGVAFFNREDFEKIEKKINEAKKNADILIVSLHSGTEYSKNPTNFQKEFSRTCIDGGADLILGHHPHVSQPVEQYKNGWIAYSLGNFIFDQSFSTETMQGTLLEVLIENGIIKEINQKKVEISKNFQPYLK